jgi:hypothetical protein
MHEWWKEYEWYWFCFGQIIQTLKLLFFYIYKVGFIREKGKATAREE